MNNNLTEIIAILDRSGSMDHLTAETIDGYNSFIKEQQNIDAQEKIISILQSTEVYDELVSIDPDEAQYEHDEGRYDGEI